MTQNEFTANNVGLGHQADCWPVQVYLLYLSVAAVGVTVLLAVSLYCSVRRRVGSSGQPQHYTVEGYTLSRGGDRGGYTLSRGGSVVGGSVEGGYTLRLQGEGLREGQALQEY